MARRRRHLAELRRDPQKVRAAATRLRMSRVGLKRFKIAVEVSRYGGEYVAQACVRGGRRRCATDHGHSPTAALRGALRRLTDKV